MDVKTVEEPTLTSMSLVTYLLVAGGLIAAAVLPTFVVPGYGALGSTVVLVLLLGLFGWAFVSSLYALWASPNGQSVASVPAFDDQSVPAVDDQFGSYSPSAYPTPSRPKKVDG